MAIKDYFMLCESCVEKELKNFDDVRFQANLKYDGERVMALKEGDKIILFNRRGNIITYKFNEVVQALKKLPFDFMIDGEMISFDNNFSSLQRRALTKDVTKIKELEKIIPIKFMVFDLLSFKQNLVSQQPLNKRLLLLKEIFEKNDDRHLELVEYGKIETMFSLAKENDGEGIIIKDMFSSYESKRSKSWIKCKLFKETTITITGFTENNAGIRATDEKNNAVQIAGHHAREVKAVLEADGYAEIQVQYLSISKEGRMRFPSYRGLKTAKILKNEAVGSPTIEENEVGNTNPYPK